MTSAPKMAPQIVPGPEDPPGEGSGAAHHLHCQATCRPTPHPGKAFAAAAWTLLKHVVRADRRKCVTHFGVVLFGARCLSQAFAPRLGRADMPGPCVCAVGFKTGPGQVRVSYAKSLVALQLVLCPILLASLSGSVARASFRPQSKRARIDITHAPGLPHLE